MIPCDHLERCRNAARYGSQRKRKTPQRVYWRDCMSRSGPNMKPPNSIAPVARNASASFPVNPHAATKVGAARMIVTASCVFPEGIHTRLSTVHSTLWQRFISFYLSDEFCRSLVSSKIHPSALSLTEKHKSYIFCPYSEAARQYSRIFVETPTLKS
jgi:hypothetical protein